MPEAQGGNWWQELVSGLWLLLERVPTVCPVCGESEAPSPETPWPCAPCRQAAQLFSSPACRGCGWPAGAGFPCACARVPPELDRVVAAGAYQGVLRDILHRFKYGKHTGLLPFLLEGLERRLEQEELLQAGDSGAVPLVPVPLHPEREWERGFNQARLLAQGLARGSGFTLADGLRRVKNTPPNSSLEAPARQRSLTGAFRWRGRPWRGRPVWLVDDIFTTGATAAACARALHEAGAGPVHLLVVALVPAGRA